MRCALLIAAALLTSASCEKARPPAPVPASSYFVLEKEYRSHCLSEYEGLPPFGGRVVEGEFLYAPAASLNYERSFIARINLLTGECSELFPLPDKAGATDPVAISRGHMVITDGLHYRAYRRSDWSRQGSINLGDDVIAATISGSTLFLLQHARAGEDTNGSVSRFSLPDMRYLGSDPIPPQEHNWWEGNSTPRTFLMHNNIRYNIAAYDIATGAFREIDLRETASFRKRCGSNTQLLDADTVFVNMGCGFYVVALKSLVVDYRIELSPGRVFADAVRSGELLYVFERPTDSDLTYNIRVFELKTGKEVANPPPLSFQAQRLFAIGPHLVTVVGEEGYRRGVRVRVYRMRTRS